MVGSRDNVPGLEVCMYPTPHKPFNIVLRVVFDAGSRGDLCFHPFYGLGVVTIEYTAAHGQ